MCDVALVKKVFRECDFQIVIPGDAYADFTVDNSKPSVTLIRMSFDGWGCFSNLSLALTEEDSRLLLDIIREAQGRCEDDGKKPEPGSFEVIPIPRASEVIQRFFAYNKTNLNADMADALQQYNLIDSVPEGLGVREGPFAELRKYIEKNIQ